MRYREGALAIAGALLWLSGPAEAVAQAYQPDPYELEEEIEQLDERIAQAEELLEQVEQGGVYLVTNGMVVDVVTREQLVNWATDQLYREGTGIGGGQNNEFVLRRVQNAVATSPRLVAGLRETLREDRVRRGVVEARLDGYRGQVRSAGIGMGCALPRRWRVELAGQRGSTEVSADASGNLSGPGITSGRATLTGSRLTIQWFGRVGQEELGGRYLVTLDRSCGGTGELILDVLPRGASELGIRGGAVTFTSAPPS